MKSLDVVTKSHVFGDDTERIEIPEEKDVREMVKNSVKSVKEEIKSLQKDVEETQGELTSFYQDYCDAMNACSEAMKTLQKDMKKKEDSIQTAVDKKINSFNDSFKKKGKELSTEFVQGCRSDVQKYFERLAEYAKDIKTDIEELQKTRQIIDEQLKMSTSIAKYLMDLYDKMELANRSECPVRHENPSVSMAVETIQEQPVNLSDSFFKRFWKSIKSIFK